MRVDGGGATCEREALLLLLMAADGFKAPLVVQTLGHVSFRSAGP